MANKMITRVYLDKNGVKVTVFHVSKNGALKWQHPYDERDRCEVCTPK